MFRQRPFGQAFKALLGVALFMVMSSSLPVSADSEIIIKGRCRMGGCGFTKILSINVIARSHRGVLNELSEQSDFVEVPMLNDEPQWDRIGTPQFRDLPSTIWVFCSFASPAVIFYSSDDQSYVVDVISPGFEYFGYNTVSHLIYWRVCHGVALDEGTLSDTSVSNRARQLGYRSLGDRAAEQHFQTMKQVRRFLGV
jgi:hypothetical protein